MSAPTDPAKAAQSHAALLDSLKRGADEYPKPEGVRFSYGTAGFRTLGDRLPSVMFRCALLAALRSKKLNGATVGVMITASHNPEQDNGVKLVDPSGEMLDPNWEAYATELANCSTSEQLLSTFFDLAQHLHVDLTKDATVIYAYDTRPSGPKLVAAFERGLSAFDGQGQGQGQSGSGSVKSVNLGIQTTPVLHYVVRATNDKSGESGEATVEGYYERMASAFKTLVGNKGPLKPLYVDCANGVGAQALSVLSSHISSLIPLHSLNTATTAPGALNSQCGADYVKTRQALPPSVAAAGHLTKADTRGCSLDGDADRLIYYYLAEGKTFRLLDGDKIAVMVAQFLGDLVKKAKLGSEGEEGDGEGVEVGVVQTAYANGSSTRYIKGRGIPVTCVPTGVKHLHHAAQKYSIGVYFEANGHGTVLFSPSCLSALQTASPDSPAAKNAITQLLALSRLVNQAVGDALSDMLLVETVLAHRGWNAAEWDAAYEDLPNRLLKVEVPDRWLFETTDAERKLVRPENLQKRIDEAANKVEGGRSFVRPSGTEDCVRVYAEARTTAGAEGLGQTVADLVRQYSQLG